MAHAAALNGCKVIQREAQQAQSLYSLKTHLVKSGEFWNVKGYLEILHRILTLWRLLLTVNLK